MKLLDELLLIEASGSHYEIGYSIGAAARKLIARSIDNYRITIPGEGWEDPWIMPTGYLEAACETFPQFVEELQGMAAGSGQSFSDLFFLNALEEVLDRKPFSACTAVAISTPDGVWLGHNEDWYAGDTDTVIAVCVHPKGKPAFISVTAAPFLAAVGVNEAGLAQGVNSLSSLDCRMGVPRMFAARAVLEADSVEEAIEKASPDGRAGGYNHLLAHANGKIGNLETSACAADYLPAERIAYHTNHYVSSKLKPLEKEASKHSITRYRRLGELCQAMPKIHRHPSALVEILRDHKYRPRSICRHAEEQDSVDSTIFSVIFEPTTFSAFVTVGNPCLTVYSKLDFK